MKLLIFGSTGGTGKQVVDQALQQGHSVTAFTRSPGKLEQKHEKLRLVEGDVLDDSSVVNAMPGHDAVICSLGTPAMNKSKLRAKGTLNIIHAMQQSGIRRFICQSGLGCGDSYHLLPYHYKYLILPLMLRYVYEDHELQERYINESQLDWTIVRPAALTNGKHTGQYWSGSTPSGISLTMKISRADVADFILKQLTDDDYLHKTPGISYTKN